MKASASWLWLVIILSALLIAVAGGLVAWTLEESPAEQAARADAVGAPAVGAARRAVLPADTPAAAPLLAAGAVAALKLEAEQQAAAGQVNAALATYTRAFDGTAAGSREHAVVAARLARLYADRGRTRTAEQFYREVLACDPNDPEALYAIGSFHDDPAGVNRDELERALAAYRALAQTAPFFRDTADRIRVLEARLAELDAAAGGRCAHCGNSHTPDAPCATAAAAAVIP